VARARAIAEARAELARRYIPRGSLSAHEGEVFGGHTIEKHVGKDVNYLADRLDAEPDSRFMSTFTDLDEANAAIGEALSKRQGEIWRFVKSGKPDCAVDVYLGRDVGRILDRADLGVGPLRTSPGRGVTIFLVKDSGCEAGYRILSAFPTL